MRQARSIFAHVVVAVVVAFAALSLHATIARAEPPPAADRAAELKRVGDAAMDSLRYEEAIAAYTEAYNLSSNPVFLYNRGRVYQARSEYPEALVDLERFDRDAPADLKAKVPRLAELLAEVRNRVATLALQCNVRGATVVVRGKVVGATPLAALTLNAGPATIDITADGYAPYHLERTLPGGSLSTIDVALLSKERSGTLAIRSAAGASVFIDGKAAGNVPVEVVVEAGSHTIVVRKDSFEDVKTTAIVAAGARKEITVDLASTPAITQRWWFWTGVGVVVLGGTALAFALLTEKSPSSGDQFMPSQVRSALVRW